MYGETFAMLAGYNAWANERLFAAAERLPGDGFSADRGLFFGSIMGTLNHLLAADRIWMKRFTGEGEAPDRLDAILHPDFAALRAARRAEDARISVYLASLPETAFASTFTYRRMTDTSSHTQALAPALFHLFNHQTHHRGQCHAALTGLGVEAPSLDMVAFQRDSAPG
jgi:uncharacterized damage-inducible protein DinB